MPATGALFKPQKDWISTQGTFLRLRFLHVGWQQPRLLSAPLLKKKLLVV